MFREFWNLDTTTQQLHHVGHHIPILHTVRVEISTIYSLLKQSVCLKYILKKLFKIYGHPDGPKNPFIWSLKGTFIFGASGNKNIQDRKFFLSRMNILVFRIIEIENQMSKLAYKNQGPKLTDRMAPVGALRPIHVKNFWTVRRWFEACDYHNC